MYARARVSVDNSRVARILLLGIPPVRQLRHARVKPGTRTRQEKYCKQQMMRKHSVCVQARNVRLQNGRWVKVTMHRTFTTMIVG